MLRFASIFIFAAVCFACSGCVRPDSANRPFATSGLMARQINITGLGNELRKLQSGESEYDFFGITSNGIDCVYFMRDGQNFQIEFEAMGDEQMPYIEKLKDFATSKGFGTSMTTYGNKPLSGGLKEAPVIRIVTNSDLSKTAEIGEEMQKSIFGNDEGTVYDVVP